MLWADLLCLSIKQPFTGFHQIFLEQAYHIKTIWTCVSLILSSYLDHETIWWKELIPCFEHSHSISTEQPVTGFGQTFCYRHAIWKELDWCRRLISLPTLCHWHYCRLLLFTMTAWGWTSVVFKAIIMPCDDQEKVVSEKVTWLDYVCCIWNSRNLLTIHKDFTLGPNGFLFNEPRC